MKLSTKLTLFVTLSKLAIVLFFVLTLPYVVDYIAARYTDNVLRQQKSKVLKVVTQNGVDFYLEGQESYGSYTLLREEYIALEPVEDSVVIDTIETAERVIEQDTLSYRVLSHTFKAKDQNYLLEVAKATSTMTQYSRPLQRIALYVLLSLIFITLIIDLFFTHHLIKPLSAIIKSKLINQKFPFAKHQQAVRTSTSHELMTPIGILQNKIENLMEHEEVSDMIQQRLSEMLRTLSRLKKIVNSLLLISRIENEQFAKSESVNIYQLLKEVMDEISHRLEEHEISFEMKLNPGITFSSANHDLLFQLFYNLVNNAIRYNKPQGSLSISDEYQNGNYSVHIKDTGIGIPEEEIPLIFNRFKKTNLLQAGGYGLGLSIVKSIAVYHNITLKVNSKVDEGTTFSVIFPKGNISIPPDK